jgi:hypothetical protein
VDLPVGHCEQSWEGGRSRLVSPDIGLGEKGTSKNQIFVAMLRCAQKITSCIYYICGGAIFCLRLA